MRLSEIPEEKLKEIIKFLEENKKNYPVTTSPNGKVKVKTLPELVKERFGVELSPNQIYTLLRGYKTVRVKIDGEALRQLEEAFGDVSSGIKAVLSSVKTKVPEELKPAVLKLSEASKSRALTWQEVVDILRSLGYQDPAKVVGELFGYGLGERDGDGYRFYRVALPKGLEILKFLNVY